MDTLSVIGALILCYLIVKISQWWDKRKEEKDRQREIEMKQSAVAIQTYDDVATISKSTMEETKERIGTRELFMKTLTEIGCQYNLPEEQDDDRIFFAYQGEHFFAGVSNESIYINIYDTYWGRVDLYDIKEFSRLRKAVNEANKTCSVTIIYEIDEENKNVDVHSKSVFPFMPEMPDLGNYLRVELNEFFRAHQCVRMEMARQGETEKATT